MAAPRFSPDGPSPDGPGAAAAGPAGAPGFASLRYALPERRATLDGVACTYVDSQGPHVPVLFLAAAGQGIAQFAPQLLALGGRARCLALDLPGMGKSEKPARAESYESLARVVISLLDQADVGPCVIVGSDLGAAIGVAVTLQAPDRVEGLVLAGPAGGKHRGLRRRRLRAALAAEKLGTGGTPALRRALTVYENDPSWPAATQREARLALGDAPEFAAYARAFGQLARLAVQTPVLAGLSEIQGKVLLLWGRRDRATPYRWSAEFSRRLSSAFTTLAPLPGCGHFPNLEQPGAFNAALLQFIAPHLFETADRQGR